MGKFPLGKKVEFDDGYLEVYVGRGHAYLGWEPKEESGHYELITWNIIGSSRFIPMKPWILVEDKDHNPLNRDPESIMKYRSLFAGVHKDIDRLLNLYDNDFIIRNLEEELKERLDELGLDKSIMRGNR